MPNDVYEAALDRFTEDLNLAHRAAGSPTYSQLQQVSERLRARGGADRVDVLSRSNTHEILHGRRPQPPKWSWVRSYVSVLRTIAANNEISPDSIGPTTEWKRKYDAVRAAANQAGRRPANVGRHRKQLQRNTKRTAPAAGMAPPDFAADDLTDAREDSLVGGVLRLHSQAEPLKWWHRGGDFAPGSLNLYIYLESRAKVVRTYGPQVIPGLLQVEAYAHVNLTRRCPDASVNEITGLVELYRHRQERLDQPDFQLWAVIDEIALRNQQVSAHVMRCQITHLINVAEQPNVTLQVLNPAKLAQLDDHVQIKEPITHFRFPEEHLDDVVFIERFPDGVMLTDRKEIAHYSQLMSRLGIRATKAGNAQDRLRRIFMEL
jgi:hypothetical protein